MNNMMINMLMNNLQKQNPAAHSQLIQWMNSGQNPQQIINQMIQSGTVNQKQVDDAKAMFQKIQNQKRF